MILKTTEHTTHAHSAPCLLSESLPSFQRYDDARIFLYVRCWIDVSKRHLCDCLFGDELAQLRSASTAAAAAAADAAAAAAA